MILVGCNLRAHDGEFPHILKLDGTGVAAHVQERVVADRAGIGIVIAHMVDLIRLGGGALVARMSGLAAGLGPTFPAQGAQWRGGWVGRRRFGRVLGMLIEPGFQVGHAGVQLGNLLLLVGNLLLLIRQNAHQGLHALADRQRCSRPVVWGDTDTSRWQVEIHAASMPLIGMSVKLMPSGHQAAP
jgi:hypothetical protein